MKNFVATRITNGPKHHFFGFHDLRISSRASGRALVLSVDRIDRPPEPGSGATVCVTDPDDPGSLRGIATTTTYNFPQGARQQWLGATDQFIVNQEYNGRTVGCIYDACTGRKVSQVDCGAHVVDETSKTAYSIDYGRLHRLGGYGYSGIADRHPAEAAPARDGIVAVDLASNTNKVILSIADVVRLNGPARETHSHHFFTHLSLNPSGTRIAFLHRYRLPDGGEETCLMTVGTGGDDCRLLAKGFLSHFAWRDDQSIMIWGRKSNALSDFRSHPLLRSSVVRLGLSGAKKLMRPFIASADIMRCSFLLVRDTPEAPIAEIASGVLTKDGHPMVNDMARDWLVVDTYPDSAGFRDLMLFRFSDEVRVDLGRFRMLDDKPSREVVQQTACQIRNTMSVKFSPEQYAFTRSGLHCDLHPRWFADGKRVAFDSIHEGSRQVYAIDVGDCFLGVGQGASGV